MENRPRKRQASDTSLGRSAAPKTKKRKKVAKSSSSQSVEWRSPPSFISLTKPSSLSNPVPTHTPTKSLPINTLSPQPVSPPPQPAAPAKTKKKRAATSKSKAASEQGKSHDQPSTSQGATASTAGHGSSSKTVKANKRKLTKPLNGSWSNHISSILIYRCVNQALLQSVDPRGNLKGFDWNSLDGGLLTGEDLKMVWFFIGREYADKPLQELCEELRPFSRLTMEPFIREEIKEKYKGEAPKPPVSAYLLFCKAKGPKLKEKHPSLTQTEMAQKFGKKWRSMTADQQSKYKQQYANLRAEYEAKLQAFYEEHPDAKPSAYKTKRRHDFIDTQLTAEERRLKQLKIDRPKAPLSAYMLFCKVKRPKVHQRHPDLSAKEVTVRLSQKWKSMGEEDKIKYKQMHLENSKVYKQRLREFYDKYPEAKELLKRKRAARSGSRQKSSSVSSLSSEDKSVDAGDKQVDPVQNDDSSSSSSSSSSEDESSSHEEKRQPKKTKKGKAAAINNHRGTQAQRGDESEISSLSSSSSSSEEEQEEELDVVNVERRHNGPSKNKSKAAPTRKAQKPAASKTGPRKKLQPSLVLSPCLVGLQESSKPQENSSDSDDTDASDVSFM